MTNTPPGSAARELVLHIGTHKTGSTSIQTFLREELGAPAFPVGLFPGLEDNHAEWLLACGRSSLVASARDFFLQQGTVTGGQLESPDRRILRQTRSSTPVLAYSCEALSLFRERQEVESVRTLCSGRRLHVVICTRNASGFLASYRLTRGILGFSPSADPDSVDYIAPDSWLVDYATRIELWKQVADEVTVIDYDAVCSRDGSIIPAFAALLGMVPARDYVLNTSAGLLESLAASLRASSGNRRK